MPITRFRSSFRAADRTGINRIPELRIETPVDISLAAELLSGGSWLGPIYIAADADAEVVGLSGELETYLSNVKPGAETTTIVSNTSPGIYFGLYSELPELVEDYDEHHYVIIPKKTRVLILAETTEHLQRAMYDLLELIGYRWYWPIDGWSIAPTINNFTLSTDVTMSKQLLAVTGLGSGGGVLVATQTRLTEWMKHNGLYTNDKYPSGHVWQAIVSENQAEFNAHPEYGSNTIAQGGHGGSKLCVLESAVQAFAIQWAKDFVLADETRKTVSMAAADGSLGWHDYPCTGTNEEQTYNPSDRQILLANVVQEALDADPQYRGVRVVIQAYGETSIAPTVDINPRLIIVVTDGYYFGGQTYESVIADYEAKGAVDFWLYSYLSIITWSKDGPGKHKASNLAKIAQDAYRAHTSGTIHAYTCEASPCWGPCGMGFWILGRLLREKHTEPSVESLLARAKILRTEYLTNLFGEASDEIGNWYGLHYQEALDEPQPLFTTDLINRMYQHIQNALEMDLTDAQRERIYDLAIYTQYCDRLLVFTTNPSGTTLEPCLELAFQTRHKDLVHFRTMYFDPTWTNYINAISTSYGYTVAWNTVSDGHPWTDQYPTNETVDTWITEGLTNNPLLPFETKSFASGIDSSLYWPNTPVTGTRGIYQYQLRDSTWYLWLKDNQTSFDFIARAGIAFQNQGNAVISVYDSLDATLLGSQEIPNDRTDREYSIENLFPNTLYRIEVDTNGGVDIEWTTDYAMTRETGPDDSPFAADYSGWFYVPSGTEVVGGFTRSDRLRIWNSNNVQVYEATDNNEYFAIDTNEVWGYYRFDRANTAFNLLTVPNQMALSPNELLLPIGV